MASSVDDKSSVLLSAPSTGTKARASSVLQRNAKLYGPSNALNEESSSWNSEGGDTEESHWFRLDFGRTVQPTTLSVQFQAGFVARQGQLEYQTTTNTNSNEGDWKVLDDDVEWEDTHEMQTLTLTNAVPCTSLRLVLEECTDFYGRVILYQIQVRGQECNTAA